MAGRFHARPATDVAGRLDELVADIEDASGVALDWADLLAGRAARLGLVAAGTDIGQWDVPPAPGRGRMGRHQPGPPRRYRVGAGADRRASRSGSLGGGGPVGRPIGNPSSGRAGPSCSASPQPG